MNINRGFVKSIDAYALVLVLLATVTYPTFSQPPGSFDDDGLMKTSGNPRLLWFVYLNSFSFFFSMTDLLLCLSGKYAPMSNLRKPDPPVERGDPKTKEELAKEEPTKEELAKEEPTKEELAKEEPTKEELAKEEPTKEELAKEEPTKEELAKEEPTKEELAKEELVKFNKQLAHSVLFTLTKLLVINVLFVLSLTCCIAAYIAAGSAVQQLTISDRLSIIIPGIGGCLLYSVFVVWLFLDFALFFSFARSGSDSSLDVDCFRDFGTMIWFFLSLGGSSRTQNRFQRLARKLAETARLPSVRQLFNKASDEINCYDQNIPAPLSATRNNTPNELNAAEQTSQQQQQRSTETSNAAAGSGMAATTGTCSSKTRAHSKQPRRPFLP
ncbi:unnamed protein product [Sphagnum balticum]